MSFGFIISESIILLGIFVLLVAWAKEVVRRGYYED